MPKTAVAFYLDTDGSVPVLKWLDDLRNADRKGWANCVARINRLVEAGHELRRPEVDVLRDGVHELRAKPYCSYLPRTGVAMNAVTARRKTEKSTSDAVAILNRRIANDVTMQDLLGKACLNAKVARMIHDARTNARLTQLELARMIGTRQPVIARLEDSDYEGHSLGMLQRIADALNLQLEIELRPIRPRR